MNKIQATCYALFASACLLTAAIFMTLSQKNQSLESSAQAEMVITTNNLSFLTTRTNAGEEALFVLDNTNAHLMIYKTDLSKKRLELVGFEDLKKLFSLK